MKHALILPQVYTIRNLEDMYGDISYIHVVLFLGMHRALGFPDFNSSGIVTFLLKSQVFGEFLAKNTNTSIKNATVHIEYDIKKGKLKDY